MKQIIWMCRQVLRSRAGLWAVCCAALVLSSGCHQDMWNQPRSEALERSNFFPDTLSARPHVAGTIPFGEPRLDDHYWRGMVDGEYAETLPDRVDLSMELLERGRERYEIFCATCHGNTGYGNGMVVQRGFKAAASYHYDPTNPEPNRLKTMPPGYFFDVITNGFATMPSYASRIPVKDRWAISAYVKALQLSQDMDLDALPESAREQLLQTNTAE